jgi:hypothetical protein
MCPKKKELIGTGCVVLAGAVSLISNDDMPMLASKVSLVYSECNPFVAS